LEYWVVVVARNAAQHISRTINSILQQRTKPKIVIVVNDGSTDATGTILESYSKRNSINVLTNPDRGYDIRRVPSNINSACDYVAKAALRTDCFMISGDDCVYPPTYAETLLTRMRANTRVVIASGSPSANSNLTREHSASGSGRFVNSQFWFRVGGYPAKAGWETWLLYKAAQIGFESRLYNDLHYEHSRPRGSQHQFTYWGAAMGGLGYHPLYAMGRIARNALIRTIGLKGSTNLLRGYLLSKLGSDDPFISPFEQTLREFVVRQQTRRISSVISSRL